MASTSSESTAILREGLHLLTFLNHHLGFLARVAADRYNQSIDPGIASHMTTTLWFNRFNQENYNLENKQYSGKALMAKDEVVLAAVEENPPSIPP